MEAKLHIVAIGSFILPLFTALFMPNVQAAVNDVVMAVYVMNIASYIAMLIILKSEKGGNATRLEILSNF